MKQTLKTVKNIIVNKQSRSIVFLVINVLVIFAINSLIPTIEGSAHYTANPIEMTYLEYTTRLESDPNMALTWTSKQNIEKYRDDYIKEHPDIPIEDKYTIDPPDQFMVKAYTKFFFQYSFWYATTILHSVSAIILFYSFFNFLLNRSKAKYKRYVDLESTIDKFTDENLDPVTFEPWMEDSFNFNRKINQHIANITYKINMLKDKTPYSVKKKIKTDPTNKKVIKYLNQLENYQEQLTPEYINEYVVNKRVKYFKYIHPSFVTSGTNRVGHTIDSFSLLCSDNSRIRNDSFKKIAISTALTVLFATLMTITVITAADRPWYWMMIDIISTLAPLLIQIPAAYSYCESFMDTQLIPNLIARRTIALLYLADMQERGSVNANEDISRLGSTDNSSIIDRNNEQTDSEGI